MSSPEASSAPSSTIDPVAANALQSALAAEHAALWCYSLIIAFVPADQAKQAREDEAAHRTLRGLVEQTLTDIGAKPVSALPAYATPQPVTDARSAGNLAVVAETDALAAWRSVVERTSDGPLRTAALDAMTQGTLRCARWRVATGQTPAIPVFPGRS
ncbi:ferritin-like domain-containing protein [Pseudonocardia acidicola]|uniref:Ferritin-like domain-containing protein n=1 Tax=Pseudonocardia acidicola TaxID=2724939 RepID=A0ABX1S3D3_9PSEU|nr:ferritin-like domain-containing protein [Pseudonocardia acidicola]NMH96068.1 ferritin-like domain-containing protein [Pseudonocardia acidicola]